jgi:hypothetical protein
MHGNMENVDFQRKAIMVCVIEMQQAACRLKHPL